MNESELKQLLRDRLAVRVDDETIRYLLRKRDGAHKPIEFFGADARTGVPRREIFDPRIFSAGSSAQSPA
jgi:hypothetical protein